MKLDHPQIKNEFKIEICRDAKSFYVVSQVLNVR